MGRRSGKITLRTPARMESRRKPMESKSKEASSNDAPQDSRDILVIDRRSQMVITFKQANAAPPSQPPASKVDQKS